MENDSGNEEREKREENADKPFLSAQLPQMIIDVCHNCHREITAWADAEGGVKYKCPYCHAATTSKIVSRRKVRIEVTAPKGQVIRYGYHGAEY